MQIQELEKQRKQRGYEIAQKQKVKQKNGVWIVPSQANPRKTYEVVLYGKDKVRRLHKKQR